MDLMHITKSWCRGHAQTSWCQNFSPNSMPWITTWVSTGTRTVSTGIPSIHHFHQFMRQLIHDSLGEGRHTPKGNLGRQIRVSFKTPQSCALFNAHFRSLDHAEIPQGQGNISYCQVSEWVLSKFNGTSTPKGSYSARTGDNDCHVNSNRYSQVLHCVRAIRYQAKSEKNVRQDLIPRGATWRLLSCTPELSG